MNQQERMNRILAELETKQSLSLKDIMTITGASRDTARRDIVKLTEKNAVDRTYGGISLPHSFNRLDDYLDRATDLNDEKNRLAKAASHLLKNAQLIYLDVSTTVSFIPRHLDSNDHLLAITNSLDIADQLLRNSRSKVRILGGNIDRESRNVTGTKPLAELDHYLFDLAFISAAGIDSAGVYYAFEEEIEFKKKLRGQTKQLILLVDETKINLPHNYRVLPFEEIDTLICNQKLPAQLEEILKEASVTIINTKEK